MNTKQFSYRTIKEGFSLIEIMVVIMIIGILAAVVVPNAYRWVISGRENAAKASIRALENAIDAYHGEKGSYPKTLEDLINAKPPYLKKAEVPKDPWGNDFQYKPTPGADHPYELYSYGPEGEAAPAEDRLDVWKM